MKAEHCKQRKLSANHGVLNDGCMQAPGSGTMWLYHGINYAAVICELESVIDQQMKQQGNIMH